MARIFEPCRKTDRKASAFEGKRPGSRSVKPTWIRRSIDLGEEQRVGTLRISSAEIEVARPVPIRRGALRAGARSDWASRLGRDLCCERRRWGRAAPSTVSLEMAAPPESPQGNQSEQRKRKSATARSAVILPAAITTAACDERLGDETRASSRADRANAYGGRADRPVWAVAKVPARVRSCRARRIATSPSRGRRCSMRFDSSAAGAYPSAVEASSRDPRASPRPGAHRMASRLVVEPGEGVDDHPGDRHDEAATINKIEGGWSQRVESQALHSVSRRPRGERPDRSHRVGPYRVLVRPRTCAR